MRILSTLILLVASTAALADEDIRFRADDERWREECGACHVAYPPQLLDAAAWQAIMQKLPEHFGTDASLDAATKAHIETFLANNAGRGHATPGKGLPRITALRWFQREHREEVPRRIWESEEVRNGVNCEACHRNAATGDFSEDNIRLPEVGKRGAQ